MVFIVIYYTETGTFSNNVHNLFIRTIGSLANRLQTRTKRCILLFLFHADNTITFVERFYLRIRFIINS